MGRFEAEDEAAGEGMDDPDVFDLIREMARAGLRPAMIVFLGDAGEPRVATRGVDPMALLSDLARRGRAGRPCRREARRAGSASGLGLAPGPRSR